MSRMPCALARSTRRAAPFIARSSPNHFAMLVGIDVAADPYQQTQVVHDIELSLREAKMLTHTPGGLQVLGAVAGRRLTRRRCRSR